MAVDGTTIVQTAIGFISGNIAYILLVVGVIYVGYFIYSLINSRKTGEMPRFRLKYLLAFTLIIGFAIYCIITGQDLSTFIY